MPGCALLLGSCAASGAAPDPVLGHDDQPDLVHAVAFWWSADAPADLSERMVALYRERVATEVPGVVDVWIGPPDPSERSVVDSSFDLVIALTTLHNLPPDDCERGFAEVQRVSRGRAFVTVDDGTGIVHQAPYGGDDWGTARDHTMPLPLAVGEE